MSKEKMVVEVMGNVENLKIYWKGSGDPKDKHKIVGITFNQQSEHEFQIGDLDEMKDGLVTFGVPG